MRVTNHEGIREVVKKGQQRHRADRAGSRLPAQELIGFHVFGSLNEETNRLVRDHMIFCTGCMKMAQSIEESIAETGKKLEALCRNS